jgi:hypothetical protein
VSNDQFVFADWVAMKSLDRLINKLVISENFTMRYNEEYNKDFAVGPTVRVKYPQRFKAVDGMVFGNQAISRRTTTVNVDQPFHVPFAMDSIDVSLYSERGREAVQEEYIEPAMDEMAQQIESRAALFAYQNTSNIVGILGTDPTDDTTLASARQRLVDFGAYAGAKRAILSTGMATAIGNGLSTRFNPSSDVSKIYRQGALGELRTFDCYESVSLYSHTAGTWAGAVTVNGAGQQGAPGSTTQGQALNINCTSGDTFKKGDVFKIASVNAANPQTRRIVSSGARQFVVTQDFTATASTGTIQIKPAMYGPGDNYQNVDALPANAAALTLFPGTSSPNGKVGMQGIASLKDAFALVGVKLPELKGSTEYSKTVQDPTTGLSICLSKFNNPETRVFGWRLDTNMGFGDLYGDYLSVRILGA